MFFSFGITRFLLHRHSPGSMIIVLSMQIHMYVYMRERVKGEREKENMVI